MTCYQNRLIPSLELAFFLRETMNSLQGTNKLAFTEIGMRLFSYLIKNKRQSVTACGYWSSFVEYIAVKEKCEKYRGGNEQVQ